MIIFGKEINVDLGITEKNIKTVVIAFSSMIIFMGAYLLIWPQFQKYNEVNETFVVKQAEHQKAEQEYRTEVVKLANMKKIYEDQMLNLETLKNKFKDASLKDETDLKIVVQKLLREMGLKSNEIARSEIAEEKTSYVKKFIPYKLTGDFYQVGRFFYYLENSKWLLTFKGSDLRMGKVVDKDKREKVEASFKIGAYILKGGDIEVE